MLESVVTREGRRPGTLVLGATARSSRDATVVYTVAAFVTKDGTVVTKCTCPGWEHNTRCWHATDLQRIAVRKFNEDERHPTAVIRCTSCGRDDGTATGLCVWCRQDTAPRTTTVLEPGGCR